MSPTPNEPTESLIELSKEDEEDDEENQDVLRSRARNLLQELRGAGDAGSSSQSAAMRYRQERLKRRTNTDEKLESKDPIVPEPLDSTESKDPIAPEPLDSTESNDRK